MRGEEGESSERRECEDSGGTKRARAAPTFSDEHEVQIVEFMKEHPELYAKEHVHYMDKDQKDTLWNKIGREIRRTGPDVQGTASSLPT